MNMTGSTVLLFLVGAMVVLGLIVFTMQANKDIIEYELGGDTLLLRRGAEEERLPLENVIDANLIDPVSAKDYVQQHGSTDVESGHGRTGDLHRTSTRYCGVPIATGRLVTIVAGLSSLSTHSFRQSLVLLRIRDGGVLLLSPKYGERMVRAIGKAKRLGPSPNV